jgi:hypothetical protein
MRLTVSFSGDDASTAATAADNLFRCGDDDLIQAHTFQGMTVETRAQCKQYADVPACSGASTAASSPQTVIDYERSSAWLDC